MRMGSCLGIIFALLVFVATGVTLLFQWNANSHMTFERTAEAPVTKQHN